MDSFIYRFFAEFYIKNYGIFDIYLKFCFQNGWNAMTVKKVMAVAGKMCLLTKQATLLVGTYYRRQMGNGSEQKIPLNSRSQIPRDAVELQLGHKLDQQK